MCPPPRGASWLTRISAPIRADSARIWPSSDRSLSRLYATLLSPHTMRSGRIASGRANSGRASSDEVIRWLASTRIRGLFTMPGCTSATVTCLTGGAGLASA